MGSLVGNSLSQGLGKKSGLGVFLSVLFCSVLFCFLPSEFLRHEPGTSQEEEKSVRLGLDCVEISVLLYNDARSCISLRGGGWLNLNLLGINRYLYLWAWLPTYIRTTRLESIGLPTYHRSVSQSVQSSGIFFSSQQHLCSGCRVLPTYSTKQPAVGSSQKR